MYDELQLDTLGDKKTALFLIMSDTDSTFNFLISMVYTQLFNLLCDKADDVYGGKLPVHVRCLIDECANIGQIPNLEKLVATIRSREISACLVLQARSQLKAIYKDKENKVTKIASGFLGVVVLIALAAGVGFYAFAKQKQKKQAEKEALDPDANYTEDKGDFEIPTEDEPEEPGEEDTEPI